MENVSSNNTLLSSASFDAYVDDVATLGTNISDLNVNGESLSADLAPGKLAKGYYSVEITKDAKVLEIHVEEGYTSNKAVFVFDIPWDTEQVTSTSATASDVTSQKPTTTNAPTSATTAPVQTDTVMSYGEFTQIQIGMSYEEVCRIAGCEGEITMESGDTLYCTWQGDIHISSVALAFQSNQLTSKTQSGLSNPAAEGVSITRDEFNQLKTGMTYEEACAIIGGEGTLSLENGSGFHSAFYTWNGGSSLSHASIAFSDGELITKSQYGLT